MAFDVKRGVVVIGGGMAGVSVARELRRAGFDGPVTLVSDEAHPPYDRPPLSKQFLLDGDHQAISLVDDGLIDVELIAGKKVEGIDCERREVALAGGTTLAWGRLVLATGSQARTLPALSAAMPSAVPVLTLRTLDDARLIRSHLQPGARLVVIGGGPIGLELAATAAQLGVKSTVIEAADRLMSRSAPLVLARSLLHHHARAGVDIRLGRTVQRVGSDGVLELDDQTRLAADLIVVGIGVRANDALAVAAGLAACDGIFVDGYGRTTAPGVYATGDVTRQLNVFSGQFERIETWSNAQGQSAAVARNVAGTAPPVAYRAVPWFWSDQGELRTQVAGVVTGRDEVMRGDFAAGRGVSIHLIDGVVAGVAALNAAKEFNQFRRLIAARARIAPALLSDPAFDLAGAVRDAERAAVHEAELAALHEAESAAERAAVHEAKRAAEHVTVREAERATERAALHEAERAGERAAVYEAERAAERAQP